MYFSAQVCRREDLPVGGWESFFVAQVGASAALAGLVFVGVSINLTKIMSFKSLPDRALEAIVLLTIVLIESSLLLVPGAPRSIQALGVLAVGLAGWALDVLLHRNVMRATEHVYRRSYVVHIVMGQAAILLFVFAGIATLLFGDPGLYWTIPAIVLCYLVAIINAWILLIEINR
jgi:modulator of FtsH protease